MGGSRFLPIWLGGAALALLLLSLCVLLRPGSGQTRPALGLMAIAPTRIAAGQTVELFGSGFDDHTRAVLYQDLGHRRAIRHSLLTGGLLENATVAGDLVFLASNYRGVQVFDFSDLGRPRQLGTLATPGKALKMVVANQLAYLVDREEGFHIIDAADPANLRLLGSVELGGMALDVALQGDRAYIANSKQGLQVIDVGEPTRPRLLATLDLPGLPYAVAVQGGMAYVTSVKGGGLSIVDIGEPTRPRPVGHLPTSGQLLGLAIRDGLAYLAAGTSGLLIADVRNPGQPRLVGAVKTPSVAQKIALLGDRAYVAETAGGLRVVDIADPTRPQLLGYYGLPGQSRSVVLTQGHALVATGRNGLQVIDLAHPPDPRPIAFSADAMIRDLQYGGGRLTLAAGTRGVLFLDLHPPAPPVLLGTVADGNSAWQLAGRGDYLYVISGEQEEPLKRSLQVIDISDPRQPAITARQPVSEKLNALAVYGDYLLAATSQGLALFCLTDPAQPRRCGFLPLPAAARCITTLGDLAFISDAQGSLQVIDLCDPEAPRLVGSAPIPWTLQPFALGSEMAVHGDLVLVADGRNGLLVFSVKDRRRPRLTGVSQLPNGGLAIGVTVAEQRAYVTDSRQGLHLIDLRTPENPQLIATLSNTSWSKRIALIDDQILLANGDAGLMLLPRPVEIDQPQIGSGHNLTFSLPPNLPPGTYTVRVFNRWSSAELPGALNVGHR